VHTYKTECILPKTAAIYNSIFDFDNRKSQSRLMLSSFGNIVGFCIDWHYVYATMAILISSIHLNSNEAYKHVSMPFC